MNRQYNSESKEQNTKERQSQRVIGSFLSVIRPHLSSDKDMQIQSLHAKFLKNEIQLVDFKRQLESIIGDAQMVQQAWRKLGIQSNLTGHNSQTVIGQLQKQSQTSIQQQNQVCIQANSTSTSLETGNKTQTPSTKASTKQKRRKEALDYASSLSRDNSTTPSSGQKRSKDALGTAPSLSSKRQKPAGTLLKPLNDVTVQSGVNVKEDQLLSGPKGEIQISEFSKSVVREEEESESKKQKLSDTILDQSTKSFNDVTANCGINLMEEEEQLFAEPKEQSRTSKAIRQIFPEGEETLTMQRLPFRERMTNIISRCGIKNISKDVEHCVSLCVEKRMRGMINNLVRVSKQRVDFERLRHRTVITSDVGNQIFLMNRKLKKDLEKKQAQGLEELCDKNEAHKNTGSYGERGKEECHPKNLKESRHDDYKIEKANIAARNSIGGDDMLSKWRLMAEQARQNHKGGDSASTLQIGEDVTHEPFSTAATSGMGRNLAHMPRRKIVRTVSVKDVISVLEREPQMSKSTLVYRLYEKIADNPRGNKGASVTTQ